MIKKFLLGEPFETEAAVLRLPAQSGEPPYFSVSENFLVCALGERDIVYGLGENVRGINKRGFRYISRCSDICSHSESTEALYSAHNFIIIDGAERFGVFVDCPSEISFDVGFTDCSVLRIDIPCGSAVIYILEAESLSGIVSEIRALTGKSYIPPKWAFGYQQSRWGYRCSDDVREVARRHRELGCPLDAIYLDIDYMEDYKDFTVNFERFPDFDELVREMKELGIRLVPIIDAAVKRQEGYDVYEQGVEEGYFCEDENGEPFTVAVWPGRSCLPDVLKPQARRWFGDLYGRLISRGIEGFWNDMNEPSIFYTDSSLKKAFDFADSLRGKNIENEDYFKLCDSFTGLLRSHEQYKLFYHNTPQGRFSHESLHNLYGFNMTRAAAEAFERIAPERRMLLFSRSSYIGMHRFSGIWTGDNSAWWSHLALNVRMTPSLNMCGFLYSGADLGGFGCDCSEDLFTRWLQFGIFTPLMRNHAAWDTREKEIYQFPSKRYLTELIKLRYRLIPYIYSEFLKAALGDKMLFSPLGFVFEGDEHAARIEDQLMLGESVMLAPVTEQNAFGRNVYLPEDMLMVRFSGCEVSGQRLLPAGRHYIEIPLRELVIFIRKGRLLPLGEPATSVGELGGESFELIGCVEGEAEYILWDDDGTNRAGTASIKRVLRATAAAQR